MKMGTKQQALVFLQELVDQPLRYGLKSPDMDFYDFGFGDPLEATDLQGGKAKKYSYALHVTCRFKIIYRNDTHHVDRYYEDTPSLEFNSDIKHLLGLRVKRIALSDKNDLWIDFGDYWVVFATYENNEESWRLLTLINNKTHLVASNTWIELLN